MGIPVWKEVLCLGVHFDPRTGERHEFKPAHVKRAHKNYQRMKERGVPVPACWEHQKHIEAGNAPPTEEAIAEWKRQYARYTFAHAIDSRINERGNLDMLLDVADPADAAQLPKVKFVSPKVYTAGYWDTKGGEYDGATVAHVAATPTPVQFWQKPFELSANDTLFLSFAPADDAPEKNLPGPKTEPCPPDDDAVEAWLDELDALDAADAEALELSATDPPSEEEPNVDNDDKKPGGKGDDKGGAGGELKELIKALKSAYSAKISDKVSTLKELILVVESAGDGNDEPDLDPEPEPSEPAGGDTTAAPGGPPMLMSTLDRDPAKRERARKYAKGERTDATARIENALKGDGRTGRDPRTARQLLRRAAAVEMSFTRDLEAAGEPWTKLLADIAAYEKSALTVRLKPGAAPLDLSATLPVADPTAVAEADGQAIADYILGRRPASK